MNKSIVFKTLFLLLTASCATQTFGMQKTKKTLNNIKQWFDTHPKSKTAFALGTGLTTTFAIPILLTYLQSERDFFSNGTTAYYANYFGRIYPNFNAIIGLIGGFASGTLAYLYPQLAVTGTLALISIPVLKNAFCKYRDIGLNYGAFLANHSTNRENAILRKFMESTL